jgi:hypothetical protein
VRQTGRVERVTGQRKNILMLEGLDNEVGDHIFKRSLLVANGMKISGIAQISSSKQLSDAGLAEAARNFNMILGLPPVGIEGSAESGDFETLDECLEACEGRDCVDMVNNCKNFIDTCFWRDNNAFPL